MTTNDIYDSLLNYGYESLLLQTLSPEELRELYNRLDTEELDRELDNE